MVVLPFVLTANFSAIGAEKPANWKSQLNTPLAEEWQALFGVGLNYPARPAETWAQKLIELQRIIGKSTGGKSVPIYLSPELAATVLPALRAQGEEPGKSRTGLPLVDVPIVEVIRYLANLSNTKMAVTDHGIFLSTGKDDKAGRLPLFETSIDTEWQHIFGAGVKHPARPAETMAEKLVAFQKIVATSTGGKSLAIFLPAELAATRMPALAEKGANAIYLKIVRMPLMEALAQMSSHTNTRFTETERGILLEVVKARKSK